MKTSDHTLAFPALAAPMPRSEPTLHLGMTVDEARRLLRHAGVVFAAFRVDACRGGARTLAEAARAAHLEPAVLLDALESAICPSFDATTAPQSGEP